MPFPNQLRIARKRPGGSQLFGAILLPPAVVPRNVGTPLSAQYRAPVSTAMEEASRNRCRLACINFRVAATRPVPRPALREREQLPVRPRAISSPAVPVERRPFASGE